MAVVAYVNGRYLPVTAAAIGVEDRGFQFADGVYEVIAIYRGAFIEEAAHLDRLDRSLREIDLGLPMPLPSLRRVLREVVRRNRLDRDGIVYLQITRGAAPRAHAFPKKCRPTLTVTVRRLPPFSIARAREAVGVITLADERWRRCDIKSISLLPNVLAKQRAVERGAFEAWLIGADGRVTEGTSSNAWIVTAGGELLTHPADHNILNGITRQAVQRLARGAGLTVIERAFSVAEAKAAREAFLTSTTSCVRPVISLDGEPVGDGTTGPVTAHLVSLYFQLMEETAVVQGYG